MIQLLLLLAIALSTWLSVRLRREQKRRQHNAYPGVRCVCPNCNRDRAKFVRVIQRSGRKAGL